MGEKGGISVQTEHIFPIIKRWLYSDKEIFLREREQITEMIHQVGVSNLHLTFTVTFTNNDREPVFFNVKDAYIPIYIGEKAFYKCPNLKKVTMSDENISLNDNLSFSSGKSSVTQDTFTSFINKWFGISLKNSDGFGGSNEVSNSAVGSRALKLGDKIACQVVQQLPNGNLSVQGKKTIVNGNERMDFIGERLSLLDKIKRKYGNTLEEVLKSYEGKIGVFTDGEKLVKVIDVYTKTLPETDRMLLKEGIRIVTKESLYSLIEDYSS